MRPRSTSRRANWRVEKGYGAMARGVRPNRYGWSWAVSSGEVSDRVASRGSWLVFIGGPLALDGLSVLPRQSSIIRSGAESRSAERLDQPPGGSTARGL